MHLDAVAHQLVGNDGGSSYLLKTDFRMSVNVTAKGSHFIVPGGNFLDNGHCCILEF